MLAKRKLVLPEGTAMIHHEILSFSHQLQPQLLSFLQAEREILNLTENMLAQFDREVGDCITPALNTIAPPMKLLTRNISSRYDAGVRVN
jgi:hypothetical protein